ncbi:MAG: multiheme c-type cytochrome [Planctomycetota bacterium]
MKSAAWWTISLLLAGLLGGAVALIPLRNPPPPQKSLQETFAQPLTQAYIGDAVCARCHAAQFESHQTSGHSHTLELMGSGEKFATLLDRDFPDRERGGTFRFQRADDSVIASYTSPQEVTTRLPIQFVMGSGKHAQTFLTLIPGPNGQPTALEHRLSVYAGEKGVDLTPSHRGEPITQPIDCLGRVRRGDVAQKCIDCHSTTGQVRGTQVDDHRANINCERCHGPGREHVLAVETGATKLAILLGPSNTTALEEISSCGQCHRVPESRPSLPDPEDPLLARFQPIGLMQSACFRKSKEDLRCSTCHDPHGTSAGGDAHANAQCAKCHTPTANEARVPCRVEPQGNCVNCHMPSVTLPPGITFRDHWIRRRQPSTIQP